MSCPPPEAPPLAASRPRPARGPWAGLLLLFVALAAAGCKASPDKRLLQYLNTDGFGQRYTGNAEEENYVTIGDQLSITDSYNPGELGLNTEVDIDGTVILPEVGAVHVAGLTRTEIEALLMEKYSPYYDRLDFKVRIRAQNKLYYVFGEVEREGEKPFEGDLTIFQAVMNAVPNEETANLGRVRLIRSDPRNALIIVVNITEMLLRGDSTFNVHVQENDIIYVPATMLAQVGYFLDTLLFPVKQVLGGLSSALFSYDRLSYISGGHGGGGGLLF